MLLKKIFLLSLIIALRGYCFEKQEEVQYVDSLIDFKKVYSFMFDFKKDFGELNLTKQDLPISFLNSVFKNGYDGYPITIAIFKFPKDCEYRANHSFDKKGRLFRINVSTHDLSERGGRKLRVMELWASIVFEYYNIQNSDEFKSLYYSAIAGDISRRDWIQLNKAQEYNGWVKMQKFFKEKWSVWCEKQGMTLDDTERRSWLVNEKVNSFQKWKKVFPYDYWADYYDKYMIPYLQEKANMKDDH